RGLEADPDDLEKVERLKEMSEIPDFEADVASDLVPLARGVDDACGASIAQHLARVGTLVGGVVSRWTGVGIEAGSCRVIAQDAGGRELTGSPAFFRQQHRLVRRA